MNEVELNIINYYIPPSSSCPQGNKASPQDLLFSSKTITVGDANARRSLWSSSNQEDTQCSELSWKTEITLGSDHFPMKIELNKDTEVRASKRTFVKLSRADWDSFEQETEELFLSEEEPSEAHSGEKVFRKTLNTASPYINPSGRIPKVKPNIQPEASRLIKQRDETKINNQHSVMNAKIVFLYFKNRMENW